MTAPLADDVSRRYEYRKPGAYVEHPRSRRAITARRTDIAGFVGIAERGPLNTAVRVESWAEFVSTFGAHTPVGYLAPAVEAFYANGGRTAWIVRVAGPGAKPGTLELRAADGTVALTLRSGPAIFQNTANRGDPGAWSNRLMVSVARDGERFSLTVRDGRGVTEQWRNLLPEGDGQAPAGTTGRSVVAQLNDVVSGSRLVAVTGQGDAPPVAGGPWRFAGGDDDLAGLEINDLLVGRPGVPSGLALLEEIDEIAILAMPDLQTKPVRTPETAPPRFRCDDLDLVRDDAGWSPGDVEFPPPFAPHEIDQGHQALITQAAKLGDRFAVIDPPIDATSPSEVIEWSTRFARGEDFMSYAALYCPWTLTPDPLRLDGNVVRSVPPSGHLAGLYARIDREVGVHKAPANERLELAVDTVFPVDDREHGDANEACVNVLRPLPGGGIGVGGARTLFCAPAWRFVNVRRLVMMIEEAVAEDLAWAVFEPNARPVWTEVDRMVRGFLDDLWRNGLLDGATAEEAYSVRCDETTNPVDQRDLGRLTCLIGLRPPPPAEFVVVRVSLGGDGGAAGLSGVTRG